MSDFFSYFFLYEGRPAAGLLSREHVFMCTFILFHLVLLAIFLGSKYKNSPKAINIILRISAFIMIGLYIAEVSEGFAVLFYEHGDILNTPKGQNRLLGSIVNCLPLYLCDIAIFAIPIIAFTKGRIRTMLSDFLAIWGIPMGVIGTYLAGNVFLKAPAFSFDGLLCIFIHVVPAAVTVFLYVTGLASLQKKNMWSTTWAFMGFCAFVLFYNYLFHPFFGTNFMFFFGGDGTPFDLFRPYVRIEIYQLIVLILYVSYMLLFYYSYFFIRKKFDKNKQVENKQVNV